MSVHDRVEDGPGGAVRDVVSELVDIIKPLSAGLDLSEVLTGIVAGACGLLGARYGALGVVGPDGRHLSGFHTFGIPGDEAARIGALPQGGGVLGLVLENRHPVRLHDLTDHPRSSGFPAHHPHMHSFLGVPIRIRGIVFGNLYLADKLDGSDFTADDEALVLSLAGAAGVAIDNAHLYVQSQVRQRWSAATSVFVQSLLEAESDDPSIELMAAQVRELSGGLVTAVALLDVADRLEIRAVNRLQDTPAPDEGEPSGAILARREWDDVLAERHPTLHVPGGAADPRSRPADAAREVLGLAPDTAVALVPLGTGPRAIGVLITGWGAGDEAAAREALTQQAVYAVQAGVAILAAQANADRGRLALLEERERIARDMHDNVIQRLFATGLSLQSASRLAVHPVVSARLMKAVDELDTAIKEIRQAIFALHHEDPGENLLSALRAIAGSYAASLGFVPQVTVSGELGPMSEALRADLLAVVREALANIVRHARARSASVNVRAEAGAVTVEVVDDGIGFDPSRARSGLVNLAERAAAHGGVLDIQSGFSGSAGHGDSGHETSGTVLIWHAAEDREAR